MKSERVTPCGIRSRILFANGIKKSRQSTFGTRNQKRPGMPLEYAFSAEVKSAGAQIHVAAMLIADCQSPSWRSAVWKSPAVTAFFEKTTVQPSMIAV